MKKSKTLIGILCIALAVIVGIGEWLTVNAGTSVAVPVVCARTDIPSGTKITGDMLTVKKMGRLNLPSGVVSNASKIVGNYSVADIQSDDLVTAGKVSKTAPTYALQDGEMLYSVAVKNLADSVSGKLRSGDIVRVVVTSQTTGNNNLPAGSDTLSALQYVRVESVTASNGQDVNAQNQATSASSGTATPATVTLLVNERQVEALASLSSSEISFALVSRGDGNRAKALLEKQAALLKGAAK